MWNASERQGSCQCTCGLSGCNSRVVGVTIHGVPGGSKRCKCELCVNADSQEHKRYVAEKQASTIPQAHRRGQQWTTAELELLTRRELSNEHIAGVLKRSYQGVKTMRARLNREPKLQLAVYGETRHP